jgi:hypothetical protein
MPDILGDGTTAEREPTKPARTRGFCSSPKSSRGGATSEAGAEGHPTQRMNGGQAEPFGT